MEGREPVEVTEHEYEDGLLVRSTTTREPEWTEQDMAEQLALVHYQTTLCECCGLPKSMVQGHERDAPNFIVSKRWCHARKTLLETQWQWAKDREARPYDGAMQWSIQVQKG